MTTNIDATQNDAELRSNLERILFKLGESMLPDAVVESIYSLDYCEDGKTLMVMVELADGKTACCQFCPGLPITMKLV